MLLVSVYTPNEAPPPFQQGQRKFFGRRMPVGPPSSARASGAAGALLCFRLGRALGYSVKRRPASSGEASSTNSRGGRP